MGYEQTNSFNYNSLITRINEHRLNYTLLMYAQAMLHKHLIDPDFNSCLDENRFILGSAPKDNGNIDYFELNPEIIIDQINSYATYRKDTFETTCNNLLLANAHFLRTRILNAIYEIMVHYFSKSTPHLAKLHNLDWYRVLYILRNNASHYDNKNKKVYFPQKTPKKWKWLIESYPNVVTWSSITITNEQEGDRIRYNDAEILKLVDTAIVFFNENRAEFNIDQ